MTATLASIFKLIKRNFVTIIAIILTVLLAVSVSAGMFSHAVNYKTSAEKYFDKNKMWDFKITSTLGFTREDIIAVSNCEGVKKVTPLFAADSNASLNASGNYGTKVYGINFDSVSASADSEVAAPRLIKGSYPTNAAGCVAVVSNALEGNVRIGDTITLISNTGNITQLNYTVTGLVSSPDFSSFVTDENAVNDLGTSLVIFVSDGAFAPDTPYSELNLILEGTEELNCFSREYDVFVNTALGPVNVVSREREQKRGVGILDEYNANIEKLQKQYDYIKSEGESTLKELDKIIKEVTKRTTEEEKRLSNQKINIDWQKQELEASKNSPSYPQKKQEYEEALTKYQREKENNDINKGTVTKLENDRKTIEKSNTEKVALAKKKLDEAKTSSPSDYAQKWSVCFREDNRGFVAVRDNAARINNVFSIIPVFVLLVGVIVILAVSYLAVHNRKKEFAFLNSLAVSDKKLKQELILTNGVSAVVGGILGVALSPQIIPKAIDSVLNQIYSISFATSKNAVGFAAPFAIIFIALAVASVILSLKYVDVLEKTENNDINYEQHTVFEKIPLLIRVALRNLLREKYVFAALSVIIAIITACSLFAFSLGNNSSDINEKQYIEKEKYDLVVELTPLSDYKANEQMSAILKEQDYLAVTHDTVVISGEKVTVLIPEKIDVSAKFLPNTEKLTSDGIKITHGFAKKHSLKKGSVIEVKFGKTAVNLTVTDIVKNYVGDYAYIHPELYQTILGTTVFSDRLLIKGGENIDATLLNETGIVYSLSKKQSIDTENTNKLFSSIFYPCMALGVTALICISVVLFIRRGNELASLEATGVDLKWILAYFGIEAASVCSVGVLIGIIMALLINLPLGLLEFKGFYFVSYIGFAPIFRATVISLLITAVTYFGGLLFKIIKK